jgi:SHS2 domain-containing protein
MSDPGYRIGDHPADLELWIRGGSREELFINADRGMLDYTAPSVTPAEPIPRQIYLIALARVSRFWALARYRFMKC